MITGYICYCFRIIPGYIHSNYTQGENKYYIAVVKNALKSKHTGLIEPDKLDDLLDGINDSYGKLLLDELIIRLELTVKDFNEEMKVLVDQLVKKEKERQQILEMMKSSASVDISETDIEESADAEVDVSELSEWEQKLAKIEKG